MAMKPVDLSSPKTSSAPRFIGKNDIADLSDFTRDNNTVNSTTMQMYRKAVKEEPSDDTHLITHRAPGDE